MTGSGQPLAEPLFYCAALAGDGELVLTGEEAHHASVQRLRRGDAIALFDGRGQVARGKVAHIDRKEVRVRVTSRDLAPVPAPGLDLYCALPKGDRLAVLLDMATQLGMTRFTPVRWQRSVAEAGPRSLERWQRICLEACKQSRRVYLPEIVPALGAMEAATQARASGDSLVVAHPGEDARPVREIDPRGSARMALFVGPEGGITDAEIAGLRAAGADFVLLGPAILRIETAAAALLSAMSARAVRAAP